MNNRYIVDRKIDSTVYNTYKIHSGSIACPSFVLFIECDCSEIDVNVHPNKIEVRFSNMEIYHFIQLAVQEAVKDFHTHEKDCDSFDFFSSIQIENPTSQNMEIKDESNYISDFYDKLKDFDKKMEENSERFDAIMEQMSFVDEKKCNFGKPVGEIFSRYFLYENSEFLTILDKHAVHERIIAERLKNRDFFLETLLTPQIFPLDHSQLEVFKIKEEEFSRFFKFNFIDENLIISAVPSFLSSTKLVTLIPFLFSDNFFGSLDEIFYEYIHTYGCKNAIKTGDKISNDEAVELANAMKYIHNSAFCNHGRRTFFKLSKNQIDRNFGRRK